MTRSRCSLPFTLALLAACAASNPAGDPRGNNASAGGAGGSASRAGSSGSDFGSPIGLAGSGGVVGASGTGGTAGAAGVQGPEVCDGVDNDSNGIADDVDAEEDGVCDCLNIATIGRIGPWSDGGNVFRRWLDARSPKTAVELGDQRLTDDSLRPFQVIVVLYVADIDLTAMGQVLPAHHVFSSDEVAAFQRWVEGGGGVMTTIGYTTEEAREAINVNRLLAPFGVVYSASNRDLDGYVENWVVHPLTNGVRRIFTMNGAEPESTVGTTVGRDGSSRVAMQVTAVKDGRVVVWGDEWITYDSQWTQLQDQQVERLWLNIFKWLSPPKVCQVRIKGPD